jgi:N-acetylglucosaminyldiphosphoundecaprenol N-acetyl-beta-D-mannosaminyltransferase
MTQQSLLGIRVKQGSVEEVLEQIKKNIRSESAFTHVVSLNPENIVLTTEDGEFKDVVSSAQITIFDGVGTAIAAKLLGAPSGARITGVDLMERLIEVAVRDSLPVVLIGGNENLAADLAECYKQKHGQMKIIGLQGIKNIHRPTSEEEKEIFSIVAGMKPCWLFVAFGSPWQEKWLWKNRASLQGVVGVGVGGAFDFLSGAVTRAPGYIRIIGLEWLFRLILQPWRWRRQLRLIKFVWLVMKQRFRLS